MISNFKYLNIQKPAQSTIFESGMICGVGEISTKNWLSFG
jgi:hypothetical protein